LPEYEVTSIEEIAGRIRIGVRFTGEVSCPHCEGKKLRLRDRRIRRARHESWGERHTELELVSRKWRCLGCGRTFWQRFPGMTSRLRASERFRRSVCQKHFDGISRSRLGRREKLASSTIERWFGWFLRLMAGERISRECPRFLGIDEHFFTRRHGYATTFCDLKNHKVHDVVLGRSEASLESYLNRLEGKHLVEVVCMDLAPGYRALVKRHFPQARIVADRFHVIRTVNHHFLASWKQLDPVGSKHRGLVSLMRRHRHRLSPQQHERLSLYLRERPGAGGHLPVQTAAHLSAPGETPQPEEMPPAGHPLPARYRPAAHLWPHSPGDARRHPALLEGRNRLHVALHQK